MSQEPQTTIPAGSDLEEVLALLRPAKECGTCFACCVYIGVEELRKHAGRACTHLNGHLSNRCGIYEKKPLACSTYKCAHLQGFEVPRPDIAGYIINIYIDSITVVVFDESLAGTPADPNSHLFCAIKELTYNGLNDIRIIYHHSRKMFRLIDGDIFAGRAFKQKKGDFEGLTFEIYEPKIATYKSVSTEPQEPK